MKTCKVIMVAVAGIVLCLPGRIAHAACGETASNINPCDTGCDDIYCPMEDILPTPGGASFWEATATIYCCDSDEETNSCIDNPPAIPVSTRYNTATCVCAGLDLWGSTHVDSYGSWQGPVNTIPEQTGACPP